MPHSPARYLPSAAYRKAGIMLINHTLQGSDSDSAANYDTFFIAPYKCIVLRIDASWSIASTSGTLNVERLQGTEAHDAGDDLLSTTIDTSGAANTVNNGTLITTNAQYLELAVGDRLGLVDGGTLTNSDNLHVTVTLAPLP